MRAYGLENNSTPASFRYLSEARTMIANPPRTRGDHNHPAVAWRVMPDRVNALEQRENGSVSMFGSSSLRMPKEFITQNIVCLFYRNGIDLWASSRDPIKTAPRESGVGVGGAPALALLFGPFGAPGYHI